MATTLRLFQQDELLGELAQVKFRDVYGAFMACLIAVMLGAVLQVILTFPTERPVFLREYASETYSVWAYVGAKWTVDAILALVLCILMLSIAHPMMAFESHFVAVVLEAWLYSLSTGALALFLGSVSRSVQGAVALSPALFFPQVLFSGCFVRASDVPMPLYLIQFLNPMKYSLNLFCATEFSDTKWGSMFMGVQDVRENGGSSDLAALLIFTLFFTLLATLTLRRSGRFVFK
jgi:ABC-type multidrug transport system permease subunit